MHLKRVEINRKVPIPRKGTKYVARASGYLDQSVPVVIALRDMLKLAKTAREVKIMIRNKLIKINGKEVKDLRESIRLFNVLHADKDYALSILPTKRFFLEETQGNKRIAKVLNKKVLKRGKLQLNLHDGTNLLTTEKVKTGDSIELDIKGKLLKIIPLEEGKKVFIFSGKSAGKSGKISKIEGKKILVKFDDREVELDSAHAIVL